jgi:hypothetical protein
MSMARIYYNPPKYDPTVNDMKDELSRMSRSLMHLLALLKEFVGTYGVRFTHGVSLKVDKHTYK